MKAKQLFVSMLSTVLVVSPLASLQSANATSISSHQAVATKTNLIAVGGKPIPRPSRSSGPSPAENNQIRDIKASITRGNIGGKEYKNTGGKGGTQLPSLARGQFYREYYLGQANDNTPGKHRLVVLIGSDNRSVVKAYYTDDHYTRFTPIR